MRFITAVLPFALLAGRVVFAQTQQPLGKLPPGCLLHAVNTQDEPSDLSSVCGSNASNVQAAIADMCGQGAVSQAQAAFIATCSSAGHSVAAYTATSNGSSRPTSTRSSGMTVVTTTDADGHVVTRTAAASTSPTGNAAGNIVQKATGNYVAVVVAVVAVAAF